jgi:hypothetical protein
MGAKKKRRTAARTGASNTHDAVALHIEQTQRLDELAQASHAALRAGNIREAKRLYRDAEKVQDALQALEQQYKQHRPGDEPG